MGGKMNLKDLIVPTMLTNKDVCNYDAKRSLFGDLEKVRYHPKFNTCDMIYLEKESDAVEWFKNYIQNKKREQSEFELSDYALFNNLFYEDEKCLDFKLSRDKTARIVLSATSIDSKRVLTAKRKNDSFENTYYQAANLPSAYNIRLRLSKKALSTVEQALKAREDYQQIASFKTKTQNKQTLMTLGEYPQSYVGKLQSQKLEKEFKQGRLKLTGKKYLGGFDNSKVKPSYYQEYLINHEKFVRVDNAIQNRIYWVAIEPLKWHVNEIDNEQLELHPNKIMIAGIPFHPNLSKYTGFWQNSLLRSYLNGYSEKEAKKNGYAKYFAPHGIDFTQQNFLTEAMSDVTKLIQDIEFTVDKKKTMAVKFNESVLKGWQKINPWHKGLSDK